MQFNNEIKKQISGTTIGSKFAPLYACIYMEETGTDFLKTQELQPFSWLRYIDNTFFIWAHREAELKKFMKGLYNFLPNLQFTYELSKKGDPVSQEMLMSVYKMVQLLQIYTLTVQIVINTFIVDPHFQII